MDSLSKLRQRQQEKATANEMLRALRQDCQGCCRATPVCPGCPVLALNEVRRWADKGNE